MQVPLQDKASDFARQGKCLFRARQLALKSKASANAGKARAFERQAREVPLQDKCIARLGKSLLKARQVPLKGKASALARQGPLQGKAMKEDEPLQARHVRYKGKGTALPRQGVCVWVAKVSAFAIQGKAIA
jgi:hypothetical protein